MESAVLPQMSYEEYRQEMAKATRYTGQRTPISPGAGLMGPMSPDRQQQKPPFAGDAYRHPGYTPGSRSYGGSIGLPAPGNVGGPERDSKYRQERLEEPVPWVDDIDMNTNWFSPFQPVWPFGPPNITRPREWDYPVGYNINYIPQRVETMAMLRGMARTWGVLSTVIATRQDQLLRIPWTIQRTDRPRATGAAVDHMQKFFKRPDGKLHYGQWSRKLTYDLLELDAPCIYFSRDRAGRPLTAEVIDGATIFPLIDDAGRTPDSIIEFGSDGGVDYLKRQPAFQQIIKGQPMTDLDESELMYVPMRPRPDQPMYGYPPTEQILVQASESIRKNFYTLGYWAEGTIPDLIVTVPDAWTPRQIAMFQAHFDALLSGNLRLKSKVRFLPGGMKPFEIKDASGNALWSDRDEHLIRLACYAYSVSPAPFIKMLNRATAQNAQQMAEEEGLYPLMSYWKDCIMDPIIQERFGYDDVEFVFLPRPEPDEEKQAKIHDMRIKNGEITINEARDELGLEPIPDGDSHLIYIGATVVPLDAAVAGHALPMPGGAGPSPGASPKPTGNRPPTSAQNQPQRGAKPPTARATSKPVSPVRNQTKKFMGGFTSASASDKWVTEQSALDKVIDADSMAEANQQAGGDLHGNSNATLHSGNYPKGHVTWHGLSISVENAPGSVRGKRDGDSVVWQTRLPASYGYIRGTVGADGDQLDVLIGKDYESPYVFVSDQNKLGRKQKKIKGFDEHKIFICYKDLKSALRDYLKANSDGRGPKRLGSVVQMSIPQFKDWLATGQTHEPIEDQRFGQIVLENGALRKRLTKSDTISSATGLTWYDQTMPVLRPKKRKKRKSRRASVGGPRWLELAAD